MSHRATVQYFMKYVMWILCGKYCIAICGLPVNVWYNFWIHTRVIVMHVVVHIMMTLKCLRMRHAYDSYMHTNICNAFCMLSGTWRCTDAFATMFHLMMLMLIPHIRCILFWIYNSCKLVEINFNAIVVQKIHWIWANSLIIHELVCIWRISLILIFLTIIYFPFAKVRSIVNHLVLRAYYLPSEELTFTPKFRENLLDKTYKH